MTAARKPVRNYVCLPACVRWAALHAGRTHQSVKAGLWRSVEKQPGHKLVRLICITAAVVRLLSWPFYSASFNHFLRSCHVYLCQCSTLTEVSPLLTPPGQLCRSKLFMCLLANFVKCNKTVVKLRICTKWHRPEQTRSVSCRSMVFKPSTAVWIMCYWLNIELAVILQQILLLLSWSLCSKSTFSLSLKASVSTQLHSGLQILFHVRTTMKTSPFIAPLFSSIYVTFHAPSAEQRWFNQSSKYWLAMLCNLLINFQPTDYSFL